MDRLMTFEIAESAEIGHLRAAQHAGVDAQAVSLGLALAKAGCSYEAAILLRPRRKLWKDSDAAEAGQAALQAQAWWNKNWREFAQARQAGQRDQALQMLGDRAVLFWDMPPLLMHLGAIATRDDKLDLAEHLFRRIAASPPSPPADCQRWR